MGCPQVSQLRRLGTYYTPTPMGMSHYTIPATLGFTSFPLVSRRLVSIDGVCIVEPEPMDDCD